MDQGMRLMKAGVPLYGGREEALESWELVSEKGKRKKLEKRKEEKGDRGR